MSIFIHVPEYVVNAKTSVIGTRGSVFYLLVRSRHSGYVYNVGGDNRRVVDVICCKRKHEFGDNVMPELKQTKFRGPIQDDFEIVRRKEQSIRKAGEVGVEGEVRASRSGSCSTKASKEGRMMRWVGVKGGS